jgi:single-strand DNA-binding protein
VNTIQLIGRLTADPVLKETPNGRQVCEMRLAVQRVGQDAGAVFVDLVAWNQLAESCDRHLEKGRRIAVSGRLEHDVWKNDRQQSRQRHYVVADRVEFIDRKPNGVETGAEEPEPAAA